MKFLTLLSAFFAFCVSCAETTTTPEPADLGLTALAVSSGTLSPPFSAATTNYTATVPWEISVITVTASPVSTNRVTLTCTPPSPVSLAVGTNRVTVTVAADDGTAANTWIIDIIRLSDVSLASLAISAGSLTPALSPGVTVYARTEPLAHAVPAITVTAAATDPAATVTFIPAATLPLTDGSNSCTVRVTGSDGIAVRDYHVLLYRNGTDLSSPLLGTFKYIPGGFFQRDAGMSNISCVSPYHLCATEVTRAQFAALMGYDPSDTMYSDRLDEPVQNMHWYDAVDFCNRLSSQEGLTPVYTITDRNPPTGNPIWSATITVNWAANGYRLPTEMEWTWATMGAGTGRPPFTVNTDGWLKPFAGSTGSNSMGDYAWYYNNSGYEACPVGTRLPNELGLYDMSGNITEWLWDRYAEYPAGLLADYRGAVTGDWRVSVGAGWNCYAKYLALSNREYSPPYMGWKDYGFRVARK